MVSALLWCFAVRRRVQVMAVVLIKRGNAAAGHHRSAQRVGLSASMVAFRLSRRAMAIPFKARLAYREVGEGREQDAEALP